MKRFLKVITMFLIYTVISIRVNAYATTLTSSISMDNGYNIYLSTNDTTAGTAFGSGNSWPTTYVDTTTLLPGQNYYLHVYGYDQGGIAGFLGEFTLSGNDHKFNNNTNILLTNTTDWHGNNTGWGTSDVSLSNLGTNGIGPWGIRPNISTSATWIWSGDANSNDQAYFSTKISAVPEPGTLLLLASGLLVVLGLRKKAQGSL